MSFLRNIPYKKLITVSIIWFFIMGVGTYAVMNFEYDPETREIVYVQGQQGEPGSDGNKGEKGEKGDTGDRGATGDAGEDATQPSTFTIYTDGTTITADSAENSGFSDLSGTDASTVIQSALDLVDDNGGKVFIMQGTYQLSTRLDVRSDVVIQGEGWETILQADTGIGDIVVQVNSHQDIMIRDLQVDANNISSCCIKIRGDSKYVSVVNVELYNLIDGGAGAFIMISGGENTGHLIDGCYAHDGDQDLVEANSNFGDVRDCRFVNNYTNDTGRGITLENRGVMDCVIGDNIFSNPQTYGISLIFNERVTVVGNVIRNATETGIIVQNSEYCVIADNVISGNMSDYGIRAVASLRLTITGNVISHSADAAVTGTEGISLKNADESVIGDNVVDGAGWEKGISATNLSGILTIESNMIGNIDGDAICFYDPSVSRVLITANFIHDCTQGVNDTNSGDRHKVYSDNYFYNLDVGINSTSDGNRIVDNIFESCSTVLDLSGSNNVVQRNDGFVTENTITTTVANGESVAHKLAGTPDHVTVTCGTPVYDGEPVIVGYDTVGANNIEITCYWANGTAISDDAIKVTIHAEYEP